MSTPKQNSKGYYTLTVEDKSCELKPLNRQTLRVVMGMVMNLHKDPDYISAGQIILNTCWVSGDETLKDDSSPENMSINVAACMAACGLIEIKTADLKKN